MPQTLQDVVIVYVAVSGRQEGEKIYPQQIARRLWSAIQVTTAAGITAVVDLALANRFGAWFQNGGDKGVSGRMVVEGKAGRQRNLAGVRQ